MPAALPCPAPRRRRRPGLAVAILAVILAGCASGPRTVRRPGDTTSGLASWYGERHHGRRTASGERFDMNAMTAAHRTLPFGTRVRVTNLENGRSVVVRINDRGPFGGRNRIIDLSRAAAARLGILARGRARVEVEVLSRP